jgi:Leucine-rich repeat (LRR) protein
MKKIVLSLFTLFLSLTVSQAQNIDSAVLCCDNVDVMRIEFSFDRALEQKDTLSRLDISMQHPKLTELPQELLQFSRLTYLNLGFNRLTTVSPLLARLRGLQCLDLSGNYNLSNLPAFLNTMPKLKVIRLQDMPHWSAKKKEEMQKKFPNVKLEF